MTTRPDPTHGTPGTGLQASLEAVVAAVADLTDEVTHLAAARATADAAAGELAARLALVEALTPAPGGPPPSRYPYRYEELPDWVDEVFARLAAAHRAKWCTSWEAHPEARIRLQALWHTWEAAMAAAPGADPDWAAVDEWLRVRFDHHTTALLDVDGPFAGCVPTRGADPGRCSAPPRLAQRPLTVAHDTALARLEAHRARRRPAGVH
jgi:hypothetical protein